MPVLLCNRSCAEWKSRGVCAVHQQLHEALFHQFKFSSFKPGQLEYLLAIAHGSDVLVHMPTGGGKSMCMFLIPLSISENAMGIVITPLIGLMEQQVSHCAVLHCIHL